MNRKVSVILAAALFVTAAILFAAIPDDPTKPHAPMEFLGIGPEMFQDRGVAWVRSVSEVVKVTISELGVIAAAVLLLVQNIKTRRDLKETKEHIDMRLDRQRADITTVALAVNPNAPPAEEPTAVTYAT